MKMRSGADLSAYELDPVALVAPNKPIAGERPSSFFLQRGVACTDICCMVGFADKLGLSAKRCYILQVALNWGFRRAPPGWER